MKPNRSDKTIGLLPVACISLLLWSSAVSRAADGIWAADADGSWANGANWVGGIIADGPGSTAYFTNDITALRTITLDGSRTIGNLVFADANTGTPGGWYLTNGTVASIITLSNSAATPIVNVGAMVSGSDTTNEVRVSSVIAGGQGYIKRGAGTITLAVANTISNSFGPYVVQIEEGNIALYNIGSMAPRNLPYALNGGGLIYHGGNNFPNTNYVLSTGYIIETNAFFGDWNSTTFGTSTNVLNIVLPNNNLMNNGFTMTGFSNQMMGFSGTINVLPGVNPFVTNFFAWRINAGGGTHLYWGSSNATLNLADDDIRLRTRGTILSQSMIWGAVNGGLRTRLQGSFQADNTTTIYQIGDANVPCVFSGTIENGNGATRQTALFKSGSSSLTLEGTNTYTGVTTVGNGKFILAATATISNTPSITLLSSGATFDVSAFTGGWTNNLNQGLIGFGTATGSVVVSSGYISPGLGTSIGRYTFANDLTVTGTMTNFFKTGFGNTNDSILVRGNLILDGIVTVQVSPPTGASLIPNGTYPLFRWLGALSGDTSNLQLVYPAQVLGSTLVLQTNLVTKEISLVVSGNSAGTLTWRGDGAGNSWDHSTPNWRNGGSATIFSELDAVTFNDTGSNNVPVNLLEIVTPSAVTFNNTNKDYVLSGGGKITGVTGLAKNGGGKLTVLADNDFSGAVSINAGTVQIGNGATGGSIGTGSLVNDGTLIYNRDAELSIGSPLSGIGALIQDSTNGTLVLTGNSTHNGGILVKAGTLQLGDGIAVIPNGSVTTTITNNATLRYFYNSDANLPNGLSGNGVVNYDKNAAGNRTYTFPLTLNNGGFSGTMNVSLALRLHADTGNAGFNFGNGSQVNVVSGGQAWIDSSATNYTSSFVIAGNGWTGDTFPPSAPGLGALRLFNCTLTGPVTMVANSRIGGSSTGATIQGQVSGPYQLEIVSSSPNLDQFILTLAPASGPNAYASTLITRGVLQAGNTNAFTNSVTMTGQSRLRLNGNNITIASLSGGTPDNLTNCLVWNSSTAAPATLTVGTDDSSTFFEGIFGNGSTQPLGLTKVGAGTLGLSAISTNTGPVTVNGGVMQLVSDGSFSNSTLIAVSGGAILDVTARVDGSLNLNAGQTLKGSGQVNGNVVAGAGSTVAPGNSVGTLNVQGNITLAGTLQMELNRTNTPNNSDRLTASGTITYGGTLSTTNIGPALLTNDTFQLFPSGVSGFTTFNLATRDANNKIYTWQNNITTLGSIKVLTVAEAVNLTPTNITFSVIGNSLDMAWPADHTGWTLQSNAVSLVSPNWFDYPPTTGSRGTNHVVIPVPSTGNVYFRLRYP